MMEKSTSIPDNRYEGVFKDSPSGARGSIKQFILCMSMLLCSSPLAYGQALSFGGFQPHDAWQEQKFSISIPFVPLVGMSDMTHLGKIGQFFHMSANLYHSYCALNNASDASATDFVNAAIDMVNKANAFYHKTASYSVLSLPTLHLGFNTPYVEGRIRGGLIGYAQAHMYGLRQELSPWDIQFSDKNFNPIVPRVTTKRQLFATAQAQAVGGGDVQLLFKMPFHFDTYSITPLIGPIATLGYYVDYRAKVAIADYISLQEGLETSSVLQRYFGWNLGAVAGMDFSKEGLFHMRALFEAQSLVNQDLRFFPAYSVYFDANFPKYVRFDMAVRDLREPSESIEISHVFLTHSLGGHVALFETALGGVFNSNYPTRTFGYFTLGIGNYYAKLTLMGMFTRNTFGALMGFNVGELQWI